jgi:superfamily II DNA or RNA helicase
MKKSILNHRGYVISKSELTEKEINKLKSKLTVKPFLGDFDDENDNSEEFEVFTETKKTLTVPRYFGIKKYGNPEKVEFKGEIRKFNFNSQLRDYQIDIVNTCYNEIINNGGGLLSVGCGRGKTVMAINLAQRLEAKTLVVVHKTFLQDQWVERIKQFTNAKIGLIRQDKVDIEDKDIVIAMIQSLSMREYDINIFDQFKFVIYDESHHCASKVFSKALYKTGANYTLALSATPDRPDGLKKVMDWYLGPTIYREVRQPNKQVLTKIFKYTTNDKLFVEKTIYNAGKVKAHAPKMINNLIEIQERNNHILNILNQLRKFPERKILILSGRRSHLTFLKDSIDAQIKTDIDNKKIEDGECKTYYYLGGMKEKERKEAETNADILFATYDMAHEGLDIDRLNTVILATPKKNIIQSVGRIMRRILKNGDIRPIIIDIADELSIFKRQSEKRLKDYNESKYKVKIYYLNNNKFISYSEHLKKYMNFTDEEIKQYMNKEDLLVPKLEDILDDANVENKVEEEEDKTNKTTKNILKDDKIKEINSFDDYLF